MKPLRLVLKNFLSYREATLDFRGLHTACICGPNGAGKSSLLEAVTWVLWGQSRAAADDDAIHAGAMEVRVDFTFACAGEAYRVIRGRRRSGGGSLDLQIQTSEGSFRSLTGRGMRATQQQIDRILKLDYDTFVNSAYLRQGRADEFMTRRPSDRKQILADLLKLDRYETLSDKAKETTRQFKAKAEQLQASLVPLQVRLQEKPGIVEQRDRGLVTLEQIRDLQACDRKTYEAIQEKERQGQHLKAQFEWQKQQYQVLKNDCDRLARDGQNLHVQLGELQQLLGREAEVMAGYEQYVALQAEEEAFAACFQAHQDACQQKQQLQYRQSEQLNTLHLQLRTYASQLEALQGQSRENTAILAKAAEVEEAFQRLQKHRQQQEHLDALQLQVSPLLQRRQRLQAEIDRAGARLSARLEQLQTVAAQLGEQVAEVPRVRSRVSTVDAELQELDKKQQRRQQVQSRGEDRRAFRERLQEQQRACERNLAELAHKLELLEVPGAACPLCQHPLDEEHKQAVLTKTEAQQTDLQQQVWVLRDQLAATEKELQILRAEYRNITDELGAYDRLLQQRGQLEAQLSNSSALETQVQAISQEQKTLAQALEAGEFAQELRSELQDVETELQHLNYDERTHALVRGEVERWRWAEVKRSRMEEARQRQAELARLQPELQQKMQTLEEDIEHLQTDSSLQQEIANIDRAIAQLGYDRNVHNTAIAALKEAQVWVARYQHFERAKAQYPQYCERYRELQNLHEQRLGDLQNLQVQLDESVARIAAAPDYTAQLQALSDRLHARHQELEQAIAQQGRLEQQLLQLTELEDLVRETKSQLQQAKHQQRIYQELVQAFGKNGIQALTIENALPQLEAQTNQILARLTGNQLHVQFITQKTTRGRSKKQTKLIDTLDIAIADAQGTRAYETYSGGEGFRINFAIRLALARLLAQRAGTALQMLIIDEGFGTQDAEGCDRLIAAINAIASDFDMSLVGTRPPTVDEVEQYQPHHWRRL
ncbi:MAG: SbcC/MukB-like Walker B domain-containing protein, partial [Cyanobacteria bacterium J06641_5]